MPTISTATYPSVNFAVSVILDKRINIIILYISKQPNNTNEKCVIINFNKYFRPPVIVFMVTGIQKKHLLAIRLAISATI